MRIEFNWPTLLIPFVHKLENRGYVCDLMINSLLIINDDPIEHRLTRIVFDILGNDDLLWRWEMPRSVIDAHIQIDHEVKAMSPQQRCYLMGEWLTPQIGSLSSDSRLPPNSQALIRRFPVRFLSIAHPDRLIARCYTGMHLVGRRDIQLACSKPEKSWLFPLSGAWQISGNFDNTLAHRHMASREFGMDCLRISTDGRCRRFESEQLSDFDSFGSPVLAAGDGRVVAATRNIEDSLVDPSPRMTASDDTIRTGAPYTETRFGNDVLIEHPNGYWSYYCHLKHDSVKVASGDQVFAGEKIAEVGNSGDSRIPHLHFQINDGPDPHGSRCVPVYFANLLDIEDCPVSVITRNNSILHTN